MTILKRLCKTKYFFRAACLILCLAVALAFIPACKKNDDGEKCTLIIATDDETEPRLSYIVEQFNSKSERYFIKTENLGARGVKKYYLRSGVAKADLVTFIDYSDAAAFTDILQPLNLFSATGKYQSSMINNMRFADDNIYSLPSPGFLYSLCYNTDAFESLGISAPPATYVAATELSQNSHKEVTNSTGDTTKYAFCASSSTDEGLVNTFMAISTPAFITTTKGVNFLKSYYDGKETLAGGSYVSEWKDVLQKFKDLYDTYYFSTTSNGASDFISENSYAFYYCHDGSLQRELDKANEKGEDVPNYKFYPFVSSQSNRTSIITNPYYYVAVMKDSYEDTEKKAGIVEFLDYFTSSEGQYAAETQADGTLLEGCISFINDYDGADEQFTGKYEPLKETFESGRVFFADYFTSVFEGVGSLLRSYLNGSISIDNLLVALDKAVSENKNSAEEYDVAGTFTYEKERVGSGETEIGNLVADSVRIASASKIYAAFVPASCINASLYEGTVTSSEVEVIFTETSLIRLQVSGKVLKQIALDNVESASPASTGSSPPEKENAFLLMSGLYIKGGEVTFSANQAINDSTNYWVALPQSVIDKYSLSTKSTTTISLVGCVKEYLKSKNPVPALDGRYGI